MTPIFDYFFGPYVTPQEQRLRFVARNGIQHASETSPNDPLPEQPVVLSIYTDAALPIDRVAVYVTADGSEPEGVRGQSRHSQIAYAHLDADEPERQDSRAGEVSVHHWRAQLPGLADGALARYRIDAWNSAEPAQRWLADALDPFAAPAPEGREFAFHVDRREAPDWANDAIIYHIFVDRFAAASDQPPLRMQEDLTGFFGGTIRGITEKLDYLQRVGANCLWLSPVMDSPTYHGYNPSSYYHVSERYGTSDDLRALIAAAHARGMRILLDFVANHTSDEHPLFLAAQSGDAPQARGWYVFGPEYRNGYSAFYEVPGMPVLRTDAAPVREYLIDAARYWLTDFGADGLRLDNVSGPTHAFWTFFQEGVKQMRPDALTLGEITGGARDITSYAGRLDACMDFPLTRIIRQVFAQREAPLTDALALIETREERLPTSMASALLLDNHDMHRFLWLAENDTRRLKLAMAFLMAMPGFPVVYYGTEVGLSQRDGPAGQDVYAREPMLWGADQDAGLLEYVRWVIARRVERVSLRRGKLAPIPVTVLSGASDEVGGLARWSDGETTVMIFNNSESPAQYLLDLRRLPHMPVSVGAGTVVWLLSPDGVTSQLVHSATELAGTLPPLSAVMLAPRASARATTGAAAQ